MLESLAESEWEAYTLKTTNWSSCTSLEIGTLLAVWQDVDASVRTALLKGQPSRFNMARNLFKADALVQNTLLASLNAHELTLWEFIRLRRIIATVTENSTIREQHITRFVEIVRKEEFRLDAIVGVDWDDTVSFASVLTTNEQAVSVMKYVSEGRHLSMQWEARLIDDVLRHMWVYQARKGKPRAD